MSFNKEEIWSLSAEEKIALAEELWSSVEEELLPVSNDEIIFAEQRLKMHRENPTEGMNLESFKKYFADKYGF